MPPTTDIAGTSAVTTALAATTQPSPTRTPRTTVALVPSQQSGPIRIGDFTIPWSLIGTRTSSKTWSKSTR